MIEELVSSYAMKKFDKQIICKIPYCLLVAFLIYYFVNLQGIEWIATFSFIVFLVSAAAFNWRIRKSLDNVWGNLNFKELVKKFSSIYEGQASFIGDIGITKKSIFVVTGCISGLAFFSTMTAIFILFMKYAQLSKLLVVGFGIVATVYIIQDLVKNGFFQEDSEAKTPSQSTSMMYDFMEKYIVENSKQASVGNFAYRVLLGIAVKATGPLTYVTLPKFANSEITVYNDKEVEETIGSFTHGDKSLQLQDEQGLSFSNFFTAKSGGHFLCESITVLAKDSPREVFPYILNPDYTQPERDIKRWASFRIIEVNKNKSRPVGTLFLHMFRGANVSTKRKLHRIPDPMHEMIYFYIVGERSYVNYLKTKIEMNAAKVPSDIVERTLNLEK